MLRLAIATTLLAALLAATVAVATAEPLAWRDSGYDLAAGFRYTITLRSGRVWTGACARAIVDGTVVKAELCGSRLKVWVSGSVAFDNDVGSESATLSIVVDCDGGGSVELSGQGRIGSFGLTQSYRIMAYTETVSMWPSTATSEVQISRQRLNCPGVQPVPSTPIEESPPAGFDLTGLLLALGGAASIAVVVVVVLFGVLLVLWLLSRAGGAKRLFKSAVG